MVTTLITHPGPWRIAVSDLEPTAEFNSDRWLRRSVPAAGLPVTTSVAITIEVSRAAGGMWPRALLGGSFRPQGSELHLEVGFTGELAHDAPRTCRSLLHRPLVPGLPEEFAPAVLDGLARVADALKLPAGVLRIHAGGYGVDSSRWVFERAASGFGWVLHQTYQPGGLQLANLTRLGRVSQVVGGDRGSLVG